MVVFAGYGQLATGNWQLASKVPGMHLMVDCE